jgi:type II secretory pathway pseudopilin PulG
MLMISWSLFKRPTTDQRGFGLIWILLVISGLVIAASVALLSQQPGETANGATITWQRMDAIQKAVGNYKTNNGGTPPTLDALVTKPASAPVCAPDTNASSATFRQIRGWCGPYLDNPLPGSDTFKRDGWKTLLQYNGTTLTSCGPNRVCGDGDDIKITL